MTLSFWRQELETAGYRPFRDSFKDRSEAHTAVSDRMYQGSWQKRVRDKRGTRYFVTISIYQWPDGKRSASVENQFSIRDELADTCNVNKGISSIAEAESFFDDMWRRMGWGYYEVDNPEAPVGLRDARTYGGRTIAVVAV